MCVCVCACVCKEIKIGEKGKEKKLCMNINNVKSQFIKKV